MPRPDAAIDYRRAAIPAVTQLSILAALGAGPRLSAESRLSQEPTPIYDLNEEVLFWRAPIEGDQSIPGYVDVAAHPALAAPLVAVSHGIAWTPERFIEEARASVPADVVDKVDEVFFVAYSFPKVAVQFLAEGTEIAMIELFTGQPVPPPADREPDEPPRNFDRWSFLDELPTRTRRARTARLDERLDSLTELSRLFEVDDTRLVRIEEAKLFDLLRPRTDSWDLHFSGRATDHATCFELRGQETNVWCVAGSVQMVLDFYRYTYPQTRIAADLGLGTLANPSGLPYTQDALVTTVLQNLSNNALTSTMNTSPTFAQYRSEIRANRPLVSFIPGHSRAVAGYTRTTSPLFPAANFQGLLVFDPWPPNAGVITRWENFDTSVYRRTFTAAVTLV